MGVRVLFDRDENAAVIYDSVTDTAFGPVFYVDGERCLNADDVALGFLQFAAEVADADPRLLTEAELSALVSRWDSARAYLGETTADLGFIVRHAVDYDTVATMRGVS